MDIKNKQRLWSKYYLLNERKDNFSHLVEFVLKETKSQPGYTNIRVLSQKIKKTIRYMLKALPKKEIMKRYTRQIRFKEGTDISKNQVIERILKYLP